MIWLSKARIFGQIFKINRLKCAQTVNYNSYNIAHRSYQTETKIIKDVILFKYDNPRFYKYLNIFALVQFLFWAFMGKYSIASLKDVPVGEITDKELPWWRKVNLGEGKYKHSLATISYIIGFSVLGCAWMFTIRSVRYLILLKGGDKLSIVTYTPLGPNRILTVPLNKVSSLTSRTGSTSTLPLKVFGHRFYYLLDMRGEFKNPKLFDFTAGLQRKFTT